MHTLTIYQPRGDTAWATSARVRLQALNIGDHSTDNASRVIQAANSLLLKDLTLGQAPAPAFEQLRCNNLSTLTSLFLSYCPALSSFARWQLPQLQCLSLCSCGSLVGMRGLPSSLNQ